MTKQAYFKELDPMLRITVMGRARDFINANLLGIKDELKVYEDETHTDKLSTADLALKVKELRYNAEQARSLVKQLEDDFELLTYLNNDSLKIDDQGNITGFSKQLNEPKTLEFVQNETSFHRSYRAKSKDFDYIILKFHDERRFYLSIVKDAKGDTEVVLKEDFGSIANAFSTAQEYHTEHLRAKQEA